MTERLKNSQFVGIVSQENPVQGKEYKIEMAKVIYNGSQIRLEIKRKGHITSDIGINMIEGSGIQLTFPEFSQYLK